MANALIKATEFVLESDYDALEIHAVICLERPTVIVSFKADVSDRDHVEQILDQIDEIVKGKLG